MSAAKNNGAVNNTFQTFDWIFLSHFMTNIVTITLFVFLLSCLQFVRFGYVIGLFSLCSIISWNKSLYGSIPDLFGIPFTGDIFSHNILLAGISLLIIVVGYIARTLNLNHSCYENGSPYYYQNGMYNHLMVNDMARLIEGVRKYADCNFEILARWIYVKKLPAELFSDITKTIADIQKIKPLVNSVDDKTYYKFEVLLGSEKNKMLNDTVKSISLYHHLEELFALAQNEAVKIDRDMFEEETARKYHEQEDQRKKREQDAKTRRQYYDNYNHKNNSNHSQNRTENKPKQDIKNMVLMMFQGCEGNEDKIEDRFRSLSKTYHPDMKNGNEEIYKTICSVKYELLKKC